jgi:hypothetical protein
LPLDAIPDSRHVLCGVAHYGILVDYESANEIAVSRISCAGEFVERRTA